MQTNIPVSHMATPSSLSLLAINVESIRSALKNFEFTQWVKDKPPPDIIIFSEHQLKKDMEPKTLLPGYKCLFNSLPFANKWGVGLAIKKEILIHNINISLWDLC